MRVCAEQDVDLAGGRDGPGVLGLGGDRVGGVLLADLGVQDDDVGTRLAGRPRLPGDPVDVVDVDRPGRVGGEAVEAVGGGQLGDCDRASLALEFVDLIGRIRLRLRAVGPAPPQTRRLKGVSGGGHAAHALVPGMVGGGRAPVPARVRQGRDHARQGAEGRVARGDAGR